MSLTNRPSQFGPALRADPLGSAQMLLRKETALMLAEVTHTTAAQTGIGLGSAIAVVLSWHRNKSIFFVILHGILSWFYVIYFALSRRENER